MTGTLGKIEEMAPAERLAMIRDTLFKPLDESRFQTRLRALLLADPSMAGECLRWIRVRRAVISCAARTKTG